MNRRLLFASLAVYAVAVYGSMAMMSIAAAIVGAAFLYSRVSFAASFNHRLMKPTLALSIACVASLVWASVSGLEYYGARPQIDFLKDTAKLWHIFFPFILFGALNELGEKNLFKLFRIWLAAGAAMAVFALIQHHFPIYQPMLLPHVNYEGYDPGHGIWRILKGRYHATGLSGFHLSFATIFAFPTGVWLAMTMLKVRRDGFVRNTWIMLSVAVLFLIANILTYSKTTWAVIPLMTVGFILIGIKGRARWIALGLIAVCVAAGVSSSEFRMRFSGTDSIRERTVLWEANLDMIGAHPILGVGWHHNSDLSEAYYKAKGIVESAYNQDRPFISHAHNNVLDQLSSTGLIGLAAWLWWNAVVIAMCFAIWRARGRFEGRMYVFRAFALGALGGWFAFHVGGMTQTNFWDAKVMHQMGFVVAMTMAIERLVNRRSA